MLEELQKITKKFKLQPLSKADKVTTTRPGRRGEKPVQVTREIPEGPLALVCLAKDFNELVETAFGVVYDVKHDLEARDHTVTSWHLDVPSEPIRSSRPILEAFKRGGRVNDMLPYLLDYFRDKGLVPVDRVVIHLAE